MRGLFRLLMVVIAACLPQGVAAQVPAPSLQALAGTPVVRMMAISPNGQQLAFLTRHEGVDTLVVRNLSGNRRINASLGDMLPVQLQWRDNVRVRVQVESRNRLGQRQPARAWWFNVRTGKLQRAPAPKHPAMPGAQWVMGAGEAPVARTVHDRGKGEFRVDIHTSEANAPWRTMYQVHTKERPFDVLGLDVRGQNLVLHMTTDKVPYKSLYLMDMRSGKLRPMPLFTRPGLDVERAIIDPWSHTVMGASWIDDVREFHWFEPEMEIYHKQLQATLPGQEVEISSWSKDRQRLVVKFAKPGHPPTFGLFDAPTSRLTVLAKSRPALAGTAFGEMKPFSYKARDGLNIHAYLALPANRTARNLPLVVLPHGGPESRDWIKYDWMAQVFATRGFAVFQPNFRGSDGYGINFTRAGWGEWGKAMQDDITDGVKKLIALGKVDPDRICIVGASYGGYASLAGGAFTPDLYRCVVSISGVSDLPSMLTWEQQHHGRDSRIMQYWQRSMTPEMHKRKPALQMVSPSRFAGRFKAPVLLIHDRNDTVVPIRQSREMNKALRWAGKPVKFVQQKNGDHWMSYESTRLKTASAMLDFVQANIGQNP